MEHFWHNRAGSGPDADPKIEAKFSAIVPQQKMKQQSVLKRGSYVQQPKGFTAVEVLTA